ncbi:hypothetical protein GOODEAATRI_006978 [Goodea atripinnis]|uniref:Uncharacterized protein n=1 Tax=Goodea atripinnis TaxID=208336 RepID=A0ABV0PW72_9TELE
MIPEIQENVQMCFGFQMLENLCSWITRVPCFLKEPGFALRSLKMLDSQDIVEVFMTPLFPRRSVDLRNQQDFFSLPSPTTLLGVKPGLRAPPSVTYSEYLPVSGAKLT